MLLLLLLLLLKLCNCLLSRVAALLQLQGPLFLLLLLLYALLWRCQHPMY